MLFPGNDRRFRRVWLACHHSPDPDLAPDDRPRVLAQPVVHPDAATPREVHDVPVQAAKAEHRLPPGAD